MKIRKWAEHELFRWPALLKRRVQAAPPAFDLIALPNVFSAWPHPGRVAIPWSISWAVGKPRDKQSGVWSIAKKKSRQLRGGSSKMAGVGAVDGAERRQEMSSNSKPSAFADEKSSQRRLVNLLIASHELTTDDNFRLTRPPFEKLIKHLPPGHIFMLFDPKCRGYLFIPLCQNPVNCTPSFNHGNNSVPHVGGWYMIWEHKGNYTA